MAPKKGKKMDIGDFLADDSFGGTSWADEEVDLNTIGLTVNSSTAVPIASASSGASFGGSKDRFGGDRPSAGAFEERRERKEFPVPDAPPYRARVGNLPWEVQESEVGRWFEDQLQATDIITDIKLPVDRETGRLKGTAFITFTEREVLEEALNLTLSEFAGRKIFVNVAAPLNTAMDGDWRSVRRGPLDGGREEPNLDWGAARSSTGTLPPRERRERPDRGDRPPREEPNLDWGAARSTTVTLPPRERREFDRGDRPERSERPKREEPELDWGSARGAALPPRERRERPESDRSERPPRRQEPELDWGSARGAALPPRERSQRSERIDRPKKEEPALDWRRGQALPARERKPRAISGSKKEDTKDDTPRPQKSSFSVLASEGEDSDEETESKPEKSETKPSADLESATQKLSIQDDSKDSQGWEVVGK